MGINLKELVVKKEISIDSLKGRRLAVDAYNNLYQYLTTIRARDGAVFTDSHGNVTSHLIGLFHRATQLMMKDLKLAFVFDGKPPLLKKKTAELRAEIKKGAMEKFVEAEKVGDVAQMKKFASRTAVLNKEMIEDAQKLIRALGLPIIQAPSEGEAQAAFMTSAGDAYAVVSQDFDSLLFGCSRVVRNLSVEGKRKMPWKLQYEIVPPEIIVLSEVLEKLGIDPSQLVAMALLIGTDYNPKGIPGIGPAKALKLVKNERDMDKLFEEVKWKEHFDFPWQEAFDTIVKMPVVRDYSLVWKVPDVAKVREILVEEHDFEPKRVDDRLKKCVQEWETQKQTGLGRWG